MGWVYKGWQLGLETSVLPPTGDYGVLARGLVSAVVVEHEYPGQGRGCTYGAGDVLLSLHFLSSSGGGDTSSCALCQAITSTEEDM